MVGVTPILKQMADLFSEHQCSILAVQEVPREHTGRYGIVQGEKVTAELVKITGLVQKTHPTVAPSTPAVAGRYIVTSSVEEFSAG